MDISGSGKSPNASLSFRYKADNEELEEIFQICDDDPPTPQCEPPPPSQSESPKRNEKSSSIIDKYFKSMRSEKSDKPEEPKITDSKNDEPKMSTTPKEVSSSPMKEYLNRLGKRGGNSEVNIDGKEVPNETWKIFHDFKFKIAQAVEDMKSRSVEEQRDKSVPRESSMSDSEDNLTPKDSDQQSVGDTDNQVSSLESSIQNLSDMTQPLTAKPAELFTLPVVLKKISDSSDDTHKNLSVHSESMEAPDMLDDSSMLDVESGVEALEDTNMDFMGDINNTETDSPIANKIVCEPLLPNKPNIANGLTETNKNINGKPPKKEKTNSFFSYTLLFLTIFLMFSHIIFPNSNMWNGFLLGLWFFYVISITKDWVLDILFSGSDEERHLKRTSTPTSFYTIPSVKEHKPLKKHEGWINHYRGPEYDPYTYHISKTTTAFMKLEGCNLRISYTRTKIAKRALWDEKIEKEKIEFYQHRLYNLTGARVILLPKGLVNKRQWSKKYPICIILSDKEKIQVLERESVSSEKKVSTDINTADKKKESQQEVETETNASPEKKKKFVWRRREKSLSSEAETGKEGLRHRLVRKIHRDKKTDSSPSITEPTESPTIVDKTPVDETSFHDTMDPSKSATSTVKEELADDELDDSELSKIKDILEETCQESEANQDYPEGEWSIHFRPSKDKNSRIFLFTRTGRDKHEWYRVLSLAVREANASLVETSAPDEKSASEPASEKEPSETAVYKVNKESEKETVAFGGKTALKSDSLTTEELNSSKQESKMSAPVNTPSDMENYEKTFWPYLMKIMQSKAAEPECQCKLLPAEVTWLNTIIARLAFDVMRNSVVIEKLQKRIQKKLNTLKLPAFMSPLVVTELSLAGACPLAARLGPAARDARGVWLDAALRYEGGAYITVLTQINFMHLKKSGNIPFEDQLSISDNNAVEIENDVVFESKNLTEEDLLRRRKPAIFHSDVEDSAESSDDDAPPDPVDSDDALPAQDSLSNTGEGGYSKKKFFRMVDKITTHKYFQQVTDYKYVKRAMEGLSNTDIKLQLEIQGLEGSLALNLPPPPHDRVWIGFRTNPQLILKARPAFGARTLRFGHITKWIEEKLSREFEKFLVMPNMEDITVDLMLPTPVEFE